MPSRLTRNRTRIVVSKALISARSVSHRKYPHKEKLHRPCWHYRDLSLASSSESAYLAFLKWYNMRHWHVHLSRLHVAALIHPNQLDSPSQGPKPMPTMQAAMSTAPPQPSHIPVHLSIGSYTAISAAFSKELHHLTVSLASRTRTKCHPVQKTTKTRKNEGTRKGAARFRDRRVSQRQRMLQLLSSADSSDCLSAWRAE